MLVITLGDPLSISVSCLWQERDLWTDHPDQAVVLVGAYRQWDFQFQAQGLKGLPLRKIHSWAEVTGGGLYFLDSSPTCQAIDPRQLSELERGQIAVAALESLSRKDLKFKDLAVLTSPIDKHSCALAGFKFPGQTEYFEKIWAKDGLMILAGPRLRVGLATNHLALRDVSAALSLNLIVQKLRLFHDSLQTIFGIAKPRLAVAGLNPHCGDGGLFGDEDQKIIAPAVAVAREEGLDVKGPLPADTIFFRALSGDFDGVLAMYHDQGLGPLKTVHFYDAINVTGGLPHLRLSPDHGPAAELYGRSGARSDSFRAALLQVRQYLRW